jgi:hypothetical protein
MAVESANDQIHAEALRQINKAAPLVAAKIGPAMAEQWVAETLQRYLPGTKHVIERGQLSEPAGQAALPLLATQRECVRAVAIAEPRFEAAPAEAPQRERKIKAAMAFLKEALKDGPHPAAEVEAAGLAAGHAHATLALARKRSYIRSQRQNHQWIWSTAAQRREAAKASGIKELTN